MKPPRARSTQLTSAKRASGNKATKIEHPVPLKTKSMSLHYSSYTQDLIVSGHLSPEKFSAIDDVLDCNPSFLPKSVLDSERREWVARVPSLSPLPSCPILPYLPPKPRPRYLPRIHLLPANSLGAWLGEEERRGLGSLAEERALLSCLEVCKSS